MMRLSKAWLNVKVRAPGRGRAQGLPHEAWQGDPYPLMLFTHISAGEEKKKSQVKISNHFWLLLQSLGG